MLDHGNKNRTQHPTDANATSSRSHAVFQVSINNSVTMMCNHSNVTMTCVTMVTHCSYITMVLGFWIYIHNYAVYLYQLTN